MTAEHYENFPVASILCPPTLRAPIRAIYQFARTADDLADEGEASAEERRRLLVRYRDLLWSRAAVADMPQWPEVFGPLQREIRRSHLPLPLLDALLDAFLQDVANPHYLTRGDLLDYCSRSANPIGRLLLHLSGIRDAQALARSDAICSALQLINFWQDPSVDLQRGRCYFPAADAARHGLSLDELRAGGDTPATQALLRELVAWAADLMHQGAPLALSVPGRMGWELRLVVQGGLRILERIAAMNYRSLSTRPTLRRADLPLLCWRALRMRAGSTAPGFALR